METEVLRQCDKMSLYVGIIYRFYIFFEIKSRSLFIFFFIFQYLTPASRFMRRSNIYILHTRYEQYSYVYFFFLLPSRFRIPFHWHDQFVNKQGRRSLHDERSGLDERTKTEIFLRSLLEPSLDRYIHITWFVPIARKWRLVESPSSLFRRVEESPEVSRLFDALRIQPDSFRDDTSKLYGGGDFVCQSIREIQSVHV